MGGKLRRLMTCCMPIVSGRRRQSGAKKKKHGAQSAAQKPNVLPSYYECIDLSPDGRFSTNDILTKAQQSDEISVGSNNLHLDMWLRKPRRLAIKEAMMQHVP